MEEASEYLLKSEKLCLAMSESDRKNREKIQTGQTLGPCCLPGLWQVMDIATTKPPGTADTGLGLTLRRNLTLPFHRYHQDQTGSWLGHIRSTEHIFFLYYKASSSLAVQCVNFLACRENRNSPSACAMLIWSLDKMGTWHNSQKSW